MRTIPVGSCRYIFRCLALLFILLYPMSAAANDKVRLQLKWQHHFQFAGYYAAKEKGFYRAAGLDVELIPGSPGVDVVQKILDGKADFGVGSTDLLLRREKGAPVVVLAVIFQHSPMAFVSLKQKGVKDIQDLARSKSVIESDSPELQAYLHNEGIAAHKCGIKTPLFRGGDLLAGTADVISTSVIGETFPLSMAGKEYQFYSPRSVGIDFYGDNLFTTENLIQQRPEMVRAFREASLKGWHYAMMNQEEMVQLIHARYSHGHSLDHLRFEAKQMVPLIEESLIEIGYMNPGRWGHIAEVHAEMGMMKPGFNFKGFLYDPAPKHPDLRWFYRTLTAALFLVVVAVLVAARFSRLSAALKNTIENYKQVDKALRESESLYRSILVASPDGIIITDLNGNISMVSPAGVAMFGHQQENELLGHNIVELLSPEDRERARSDLAGMRDEVFSGVGEYRALGPDENPFEIEINCQYILDAENQPSSIVIIIRDITERKRAGHSCLLAMGEMIGAIAHQWRQPLATLGMIIQRTHAVGTLKTLTAEGLDEFKANSMRQIRYMSDTIEEFRGFYRTEKNKEPFSPLSCINDAAKLFEPQFTSHGIAVDVHCRECDELLVDGYPNEFKQVILNLLGNARDAILESRKIQGVQKDGRITVQVSVRDGKTMIIDVNDNGCGVADDIAPRVLDPYFTTKEDSGGTGLGLYMSRRIVEDSLDGRLSLVQSHEGATFRIELHLRKMP